MYRLKMKECERETGGKEGRKEIKAQGGLKTFNVSANQ
jgi:hypothetical protein